MLYEGGLTIDAVASIVGYKAPQTVFALVKRTTGISPRKKKSRAFSGKVDVSFSGLDMANRSVRRLKALEMYANGAPVKNIEEDTGIWARLLPRLAKTYGIPVRRV